MRSLSFVAIAAAALALVGAGCVTSRPKPPEVLDEATMSVALVVPQGTALPDPLPSTVDLRSETFGCGDTIVVVRAPRQSSTGNEVHDALLSLFGVGDHRESWQHHSLVDSKLAVEKIQSRDGVTTEVWLTGTVVSAGTCDNPRIKAQIEQTIALYKPKFAVYLNGSEANWRCLGDQSGTCK